MHIRVLPAAAAEWSSIPAAEQRALDNALTKLALNEDQLRFPHSSAVREAKTALRELRPRRGRSRWRAFYRRIGEDLVVAAFGPEAQVDPRGFSRAVRLAESRLAAEEQQDG